MADNFKYVQAQNFSLAGSGVVIGATTVILKSFAGIDGTLLTMTDFGTIGFGTLEPGNGTLEEQISFTGVTQNANGTATLTGVSNVLFIAPYTKTSGVLKTHAGSTTFVISNTAGFYDSLSGKDDDETVTGIWTFTNPNYPRMDAASPLPTDAEQLATKAYVDSVAVSGAPNADLTTKGIVEIATAAEIDSGATTGGTGASVVVRPDQFALSNIGLAAVGDNTDIAVGTGNKFVTQTGLQKSAEIYAASATGNDTYVITLSPVPTSYVNGMTVRFKTDVANTGAASLNVNSLGEITIKKAHDQDLVTGDIEANQIVEVIYNSTGPVFEMASQSAISPSTDVQIFLTAGADTWTKPSGAKMVEVWAFGGGGGGGSGSRNTANTVGGGGGGGGGSLVYKRFSASALGSTVGLVVGAGGAGGAAKTSDGNGNDGSNGVASSFGTNLLVANPGALGSGGTGSAGAGGAGGVITNGDITIVGGAAGAGGASVGGVQGVDSTNVISPRGGAGGGGIASSNTSAVGGGFITYYIQAGGTAGVVGSGGVPATAGGAGATIDSNLLIGGPGGGGGGGTADNQGAGNHAGIGGAGGYPGGGGGGGGAADSTSANNSGAGGAGSKGMVVVISYL